MTTLPNFDAATFNPRTPINNPYYPLKPGTIYVYDGESVDAERDNESKGDKETGNESKGDKEIGNESKGDKEIGNEIEEIIRFAVTFETKNIAGVTAQVVRETAWANGFLQEDTDDWFAQDTEGNVWYLGESTTTFEYDKDGNFIGTNNDGAWKTGVNGALPGYIMPANPQVGDSYYQEYAPNDEAVDQAKVISLDKTLSTELGNVDDVLQTLESTEVEPGVFDYKYNAPGIGLVLVEELDENLEPKFIEELESITSVTQKASEKGTEENDVLDGNQESNNLNGDDGDDVLQGFGESDRLRGEDGKDFLVGGYGLDLLKGGKGQDILIGDKGVDTLVGGQNRDQFVLRTLEDRGDLIKDFTSKDVIVLAEIFDSENYSSSHPIDDYLQIEQVGSDTSIRIDLDGDAGSESFQVLATLSNTNVNLLSNANFVV